MKTSHTLYLVCRRLIKEWKIKMQTRSKIMELLTNCSKLTSIGSGITDQCVLGCLENLCQKT